MALQRYEMLSNLDSKSYDWECKLRAQTVWKGIKKESNQCWGINVVSLDESVCDKPAAVPNISFTTKFQQFIKNFIFLFKNNRIHTFIATKHSEKLKDEPKEGAIYIVSNFTVKEYRGHETYHPVRCDKHIYFTEHTTCKKAGEDGLPIEPYAFDFFASEEIESSADDNRFLISNTHSQLCQIYNRCQI